MKKTFAMIMAAVAAITVSSCDKYIVRYNPDPYIFMVRNNTDSPVMMFVPEHGDVDCSDVTGELPEHMTEGLRQTFIRIAPRSYVSFFYSGSAPDVESPISGYHPQDKVTFYFFDRAVLDNNDWETIVSEELWLARYSYSPEDVVAMGKTVSYPAK